MNIGDCPYEDCDGMLALEVPARTPAYRLIQCEHCGRDVWYRLSRVDPQAWTREQFEAEHVIDETKRTVAPRAGEKSFRQGAPTGSVDLTKTQSDQ